MTARGDGRGGDATARRILWIGLRTSLVVGTVLNLVNQWYELFYAPEAISWLKLALNYSVPFCVPGPASAA